MIGEYDYNKLAATCRAQVDEIAALRAANARLQVALTNAELEPAIEDVRAGRCSGPYEDVDEMLADLNLPPEEQAVFNARWDKHWMTNELRKQRDEATVKSARLQGERGALQLWLRENTERDVPIVQTVRDIVDADDLGAFLARFDSDCEVVKAKRRGYDGNLEVFGTADELEDVLIDEGIHEKLGKPEELLLMGLRGRT